MKKIIISVIIFVSSCLLVITTSCATPPPLPEDEAKQLEEEIQSILQRKKSGFFYVVKQADTLWRIAQRYNVELKQLIKENPDVDPQLLRPGMKIFIPARSSKGLSVVAESKFIWPLKGSLIGQARSSGINIKAYKGQEVRAVKSGVVTFVSDYVRGYGKTIVITHADGFVSMYAYNSANLVKPGEKVKQGQVIARAGKTGRAEKPQLHFRLTKNGKEVNPINYLPK